jgi:phage-related protein
MREYLNFYYDGEYSVDKGVIQASLDSGLFDETFMATRSIVETKVKGNSKPFLHGVEYEPLEFPLTLYFENGMTEDRVREVARWINQLTYKPLYFVENQFDSPTYIFYCMYYGDIRKLHNGIKEGVINLTMRCKDSYVYSPVYMDDEIDLSTNPVGGTEIEFENKSDVELKPELYITKIVAGDISITNNSNGGEIFQFVDLADNEVVYVDNQNEEIISDIPGVYRFSNFNNNYLSMTYGINSLKIEGQCKLQLRYNFKFLTSS